MFAWTKLLRWKSRNSNLQSANYAFNAAKYSRRAPRLTLRRLQALITVRVQLHPSPYQKATLLWVKNYRPSPKRSGSRLKQRTPTGWRGGWRRRKREWRLRSRVCLYVARRRIENEQERRAQSRRPLSRLVNRAGSEARRVCQTEI